MEKRPDAGPGGPRASQVRGVEPHEHAALGELTVAVYRQVLNSQLVDYAAVLRDVPGRLAAGCEVLVAADGDRLLGGVTYVPGPGAYAQFAVAGEAELRMLVVDPVAQGRGVGTALVRACVDRARADARSALTLGTMPAMVAAQRLYRRLGFARVADRDDQVPTGLPLLCYSLDLRAAAGACSPSSGGAAGAGASSP